METKKIVFTVDDLIKCFERHDFTELPTDWCDLLFENDCHVVEVYKTPHDNMYRLLFLKKHARGRSGTTIGFFLGSLVFSKESVAEFIKFIQDDEQC